MSKLILGIDPGLASTGYGIISVKGNSLKLVTLGVISQAAGISLANRLFEIHRQMSDIIHEYSPEACSIEELFFAKNVKSAIPVAHARGVLMLAASGSGLPVFEFTPLQIKQAVVGVGRADKNQVQTMVKFLLGLKEIPKPDHASDALAAAICLAHGRMFL